MNRSVLRALKLLIGVGKHPEGTAATDVADVGLARATASRLLSSMEYAGFWPAMTAITRWAGSSRGSVDLPTRTVGSSHACKSHLKRW